MAVGVPGLFRASGRLCLLHRTLPALLLLPLLVLPAGDGTALDFETVQRQAQEHSFSLKIATADIALQKIEEQEALSYYLPTFSLRYDLGYAWALDGQQGTFTIGDSVSATDLSTWRNSLSISASLLLYDSGARSQRLEQARQGSKGAELTWEDRRQGLRLQVLDAYLEGLLSQHRAEILEQKVTLHKQLFRELERLQQAGTVGQDQVQGAALELAASLGRQDDARMERQRALAKLTELTGVPYPETTTHLSELPAPQLNLASELHVEQLPQIQTFDAELNRLHAARSTAWRELFPSIGLYGNYRWYGADPDGWNRALEDMSRRDATAAMVLQWQFAGFRDSLQVKRLDEQLRRLKWQRKQRVAELEREIGGLRQMAQHLPEYAEHLQTVRQADADAARLTRRLLEQGLLGAPEELEREIARSERTLEAEELHHRQLAEGLRLQIWQEGLKP